MCYYCENGLPEPVKKIMGDLEEINPQCEFGPGHIVFSDYNLRDVDILWCLEEVERQRQDSARLAEYGAEAMAADEAALRLLLEVPVDVRIPPGARRELAEMGMEETD